MVRTDALKIDVATGILEARGELDFAEHHLGLFAISLDKQGHFLRGEVHIEFDERDGLTSAALGHPELPEAIAFHSDVTVRWEDIKLPERQSAYAHHGRRVKLQFLSGGLPDQYEQHDFELAAMTVLEALNVFLGRAAQDYLTVVRAFPAEAGAKS